jgi:hypothetical protein
MITGRIYFSCSDSAIDFIRETNYEVLRFCSVEVSDRGYDIHFFTKCDIQLILHDALESLSWDAFDGLVEKLVVSYLERTRRQYRLDIKFPDDKLSDVVHLVDKFKATFEIRRLRKCSSG